MQFTIYSKPSCTYCEQAKALLQSKSLVYQELILDVGQQKDPLKTYVTVASLKEKLPTAKSVPQIFNGETHVGGYEALRELINNLG